MHTDHDIATGSGKFYECPSCHSDARSVLVWCWQCPEPRAYKCLGCREEWTY